MKEVVNLSSIFDISGNLKKGGKWLCPESAFTGEIVLDDDNSLYGYCNDYSGKIWYLVGCHTVKDEIGDNIEFYMLSNDHRQTPFLCIFPDIADGKGSWYECISNCNGERFFRSESEAKLVLTNERNSYQEEQRIKARFQEVELNVLMNNRIITSVLEPQT